jgi:8-oxo-dGTP diphosphatase
VLKQNIYIATDAMVFDKTGEHLKILLIKRKNDPYKNMWGFPGGFVEDDEELEAGAIRELEEETGLKLQAMKQLHTFGKVGRDPRFRTVSVTHYAFVDSAHLPVKGSDDAAEAKWFYVKDLKELAFDHNEILDFALQQLEEELTNTGQ